MAAWIVCLLQYLIKSRIQSAPEGEYPGGVREVYRVILKNEGPQVFFVVWFLSCLELLLPMLHVS